jgi:hypothetical protein
LRLPSLCSLPFPFLDIPRLPLPPSITFLVFPSSFLHPPLLETSFCVCLFTKISSDPPADTHSTKPILESPSIAQKRAPTCPIVQTAHMRHASLARQGLGSLRCRQQSPVLSSLPRLAPHGHLMHTPRDHSLPHTEHPPWSHIPPPSPLVPSCSGNGLGGPSVTALLSGLTALTNLESLDVR